MSKNKKAEATVVASPRSRSRKAGQIEQDKVTAELTQLAGRLKEIIGSDFIQLEVEPILKKLDKKKIKLTIAISMGFDKS